MTLANGDNRPLNYGRAGAFSRIRDVINEYDDDDIFARDNLKDVG